MRGNKPKQAESRLVEQSHSLEYLSLFAVSFFLVLEINSTISFFCVGWSSASSFCFTSIREWIGQDNLLAFSYFFERYWLLVDVAKGAIVKSITCSPGFFLVTITSSPGFFLVSITSSPGLF